jgi:hypothetical protein
MDTFCVLPWYNKELTASGKFTHCCWLKKDYDIKKIRADLLAGVQTSACSDCWDLEKNNQKSRRQQENEFLDYKIDKDIEKIQQDCVNNNHKVLLYQLTTSNVCNQACVSCGSLASSKWADLEKKMGKDPHTFFQIDLNQKDNVIDYGSARRVSLLGGEPFFDSATFEILEKLLEHNNNDCFISLVTNGSIALTQEKINFLSRFTDLSICVSVDGIGPVFEYMRWPGKWPTLIENIAQYRTLTKNISISYTISSLNALYYNETVEWFQQNELPYNHNMVTGPIWLSLNHAPIEIKKILMQKKNGISDLVKLNGSEISLEQYAKQIKDQDQVKKINVKDYLPEVAAIINS